MSDVQIKLDQIFFSGEEEDFVFFAEKFEAKMYILKSKDVLDKRVEVESLMTGLSETATEKQRVQAREKTQKELDYKN